MAMGLVHASYLFETELLKSSVCVCLFNVSPKLGLSSSLRNLGRLRVDSLQCFQFVCESSISFEERGRLVYCIGCHLGRGIPVFVRVKGSASSKVVGMGVSWLKHHHSGHYLRRGVVRSLEGRTKGDESSEMASGTLLFF